MSITLHSTAKFMKMWWLSE